jgi:hypothetical protein
MSVPDAAHLRRWTKAVALLAMMVWVAWSGFKPGPEDSARWYDRAIRAVGGLMILALLLAGFISNLLDGN